MKDFLEEQLWLAPWHFLLMVLNRGWLLKNHPVTRLWIVVHRFQHPPQNVFCSIYACSFWELPSLQIGKTLKLKWIVRKHRKNCEWCPGHYLIVNHYSSMSWFKFVCSHCSNCSHFSHCSQCSHWHLVTVVKSQLVSQSVSQSVS